MRHLPTKRHRRQVATATQKSLIGCLERTEGEGRERICLFSMVVIGSREVVSPLVQVKCVIFCRVRVSFIGVWRGSGFMSRPQIKETPSASLDSAAVKMIIVTRQLFPSTPAVTQSISTPVAPHLQSAQRSSVTVAAPPSLSSAGGAEGFHSSSGCIQSCFSW